MHRFVATGGPASAARHEARVVLSADEERSPAGLLLKVAFQAKRVIPLHQHLLIHRAVHRVAGGASLAHRFMLEHKRPALRRMAPGARLRLGQMRERTAVRGIPAMRIMAIAAAHLPFHDRMMMRQVELAALVEMALETSLRRLLWIQNGVPRAARLGVNATRPMTRLAAHFLCVRARRL